MQPRYPIYIPTKGRAAYSYTARALEAMGTPYNLIVEEPEREAYEASIRRPDLGKVLVLDPEFQRQYDPCMELAPGQSPGSGAARNFGWEHAKAAGYARYWCIDDNIQGWFRLHENQKIPFNDGTGLRMIEDFTERFEKVAMSGPEYYMFAPRRTRMKPYRVNTRVYSCNLIDTSLPFRWRGRYNEDTILSLDLLKAGYDTILFHTVLAWKMTTQVLPGGNTDTVYTNGTKEKSEMLWREHPDVTRLVYRYGRHHHDVDYRKFSRPLVRKVDAETFDYRGRLSLTDRRRPERVDAVAKDKK